MTIVMYKRIIIAILNLGVVFPVCSIMTNCVRLLFFLPLILLKPQCCSSSESPNCNDADRNRTMTQVSDCSWLYPLLY